MKITAFVIESDGEYTIYSKGEGGAIISDAIKEVAKMKFEEAMRAAFALSTLIAYARTNVFMKTPALDIEYLNGGIV